MPRTRIAAILFLVAALIFLGLAATTGNRGTLVPLGVVFLLLAINQFRRSRGPR